MIDFERARRTMVDTQIRTADVTDHRVLDAFYSVPRELFLPPELRSFAYRDRAVPVGKPAARGGRALLDPMVLAKLVQLAEVEDTDKVLDIGCATGYGAAVLAELAGEVVAVECDPDLAAVASARLGELGLGKARVVTGDLAAGHAAEAPYDLILIEGSVELIPPALEQQLKEGGRLVAVLAGPSMAAKAMLYRRTGDDVSGWPAFDAPAPLLPGFEKPRGFVF